MTSEIAARYLRFAELEAQGRSPLYESLARSVAEKPEILAFLAALPEARQQPNLLLAATRFVAGLPRDAADFEERLRRHEGEIAAVMLSWTTQTNEPGRCATLLPALARIEGPISLIEVGASAGLCLLPERYGYDWGRARLAGEPGAPVFPCRVSDNVPLPARQPEIVWRRGLDLNPLDVTNKEDVAWLETLVWPEDTDRLDRLRAAIALAQEVPPEVRAGDLRYDVAELIATAPADTTVVVFHTAVLSYVPSSEDRERFARDMLGSRAVWFSNESTRVFPDFAARTGPAPAKGLFLLARDGAPVAWTGPHGQSLDWI